jgi:pimeloyl-ACP methyl ester carboxylesterase
MRDMKIDVRPVLNSEKVTWVLLRGLVREKGHWGASFLRRFQEEFAPHAVLAVDLPGAGEFRDEPSPTDIAGMFRFVRSHVMTQAPTDHKIALFAVSLGAMVAMEWMRQAPEDLALGVLVNTSSKALSGPHRRLRWQIWPEFIAIMREVDARRREQLIVNLLINSQEARALAQGLWAQLAVDRPISWRTFFSQIWAAARFEGLVSRPDVPVLLLAGTGDRLVDPSCSVALARQWNWALSQHPWAGHDLPWDDPEWVLEKTKAFVSV